MITAAARAANRERETIGKTFRECPICVSKHLEYEFLIERAPVCRCQTCGLLFLNPAPESAAEQTTVAESAEFSKFHEAKAAGIIAELVGYSGIRRGRMLLVGGTSYLAEAARQQGFQPVLISAAELESGTQLPDKVDACVLFSSVEKLSDPLGGLQTVRRLLDDRGAAMVVCPTTDSKAARVFRSSWWEFNRQSRFYF
jgi:hypothetical protein